MLKGQAKKDYQRKYMKEYMRDHRLKRRVVKTPQTLNVKTLSTGFTWEQMKGLK